MPESSPTLSVIFFSEDPNQDFDQSLRSVFKGGHPAKDIDAVNTTFGSQDIRESLLEALSRAKGDYVTIVYPDSTTAFPRWTKVRKLLDRDRIIVAGSNRPQDSPNDPSWTKTLTGKITDRKQLRATIEFELDAILGRRNGTDLLWASLLAIYCPNVVHLDPLASVALNQESEPADPSMATYSGPDTTSDTTFSIQDSLLYLKRLEELRDFANTSAREELNTLTMLELAEANSWLKSNPADQQRVAEEIEIWAHIGFPYEAMNQGLGKTLVVSYAFPPDLDTAGMVMARRIRTWGKVVSVLSNDLSATNHYDAEAYQMCAPFIERQVKLPAPPTVAKWPQVSLFVREGLEYIQKNPDWFSQHDHIHSRVMLPPSHFLAAMIKLENPSLKWTAEFSDPLTRNTRNEVRHSALKPKPGDMVYQTLRSYLEEQGLLELAGDNTHMWSELLAYSLADELLFANDRHHQYMIDYVPTPELQKRVAAISRAETHPAPPQRFYQVADSPVELDKSKINIGYLGYFYDTRRLAELTDALELLTPDERDKLAVTFIGKNPKVVLERNGVDSDALNIQVYPAVSYFEALALQRDFDYLIVNDASTKEYFDFNIYLPSKISDMTYGFTKVWGITEPGSLLDGMRVDVKSHIGDSEGALSALREIIQLDGAGA